MSHLRPIDDNLRTYNGYSFDFETISKELYRIMKPGGVVVWVVGDATINGSESGTSFRQALYFKDVCGFRLHDTMIYEKCGSPYPASKKSNRYSQIFEYMFIFSKGKPKTHNLLADKLNSWGGRKAWGNLTIREKDGNLKHIKTKKERKPISKYGVRNNIWKFPSEYKPGISEKINHPAIFPQKLAKDHIRTWSNENDLVYDPFMGSGTTAKECLMLNRNFLGSEISNEYVKIANERIEPYKIKLIFEE